MSPPPALSSLQFQLKGPLGKVDTHMYIVSDNDKAGKINEVGKELESGGKCLVSLGHSQIGGL